MKVLKDCYLSEIITELFGGKTIIYPTETSYGLGCDATSQTAVDAIFKIKGRSEDKPLLIIVPTIEMAKKYLVWNNTIEHLANKYWPGPLTIIGKYNTPLTPLIREESLVPPNKEGGEVLARGVVSKLGTVAVRVSANPIAKFLSESLGKPIVATSGNISSAGDVYDPRVAEQMFINQENQPDIILDNGVLPQRLPTTLVDATEDTIKILRQGELEIQHA